MSTGRKKRVYLTDTAPERLETLCSTSYSLEAVVKSTVSTFKLYLFDDPIYFPHKVAPVYACMLFKEYIIPLDSGFISTVQSKGSGTLTVLKFPESKRLRLRYVYKQGAFTCHCFRIDEYTMQTVASMVTHNEQLVRILNSF